MTRFPGFIFAAILLVAGSAAYAATANPAEAYRCPGPTPDVLIDAELSHDATLVCNGAQRAIRFFHRLDLPVTRTIRFQLHRTLPRQDAAHVGYYDARSDRIDFLTYAACVEQCATRPPFKLPMNEELFVSFAAHETTHAMVDEITAERPVSRIAHEYLAYIVQISTMAPAERDALLQGYDLPGFEHAGQISLTYYALDPCAFGVKAYRHYTALSDPAGFLRDLLDGRIRLGNGRGEWW